MHFLNCCVLLQVKVIKKGKCKKKIAKCNLVLLFGLHIRTILDSAKACLLYFLVFNLSKLQNKSKEPEYASNYYVEQWLVEDLTHYKPTTSLSPLKRVWYAIFQPCPNLDHSFYGLDILRLLNCNMRWHILLFFFFANLWSCGILWAYDIPILKADFT